jgi:hypothetical protein
MDEQHVVTKPCRDQVEVKFDSSSCKSSTSAAESAQIATRAGLEAGKSIWLVVQTCSAAFGQ